MIERLARIASHLRGFQSWLFLLALAALASFLWRLPELDAIETDAAAMGSLLGFVWSLLLYALIALFAQVPRPSTPDDGWLLRLRLAIQRGGYRVLGAVLLALGAAVLVLSYQLLRVMIA